MKAHQPVFESHKEAYHKRYGKDESEGMAKIVFLYKIFHGSEQALQKAIAEGAVQEWDQDGLTMCSFRKQLSGVEKGALASSHVRTGEVEVKGDQFKALSKAFSNMGWEFGEQSEGRSPRPAGSSGPKSIEDAGLTEKMKEVVQDAKQAMERLQQQALKLLRKCSDEDSKKSFKGTVLELKEWIQKDEHVLTWKERL